jgi:uncharacterized protein YlaN (UPF0358 family)
MRCGVSDDSCRQIRRLLHSQLGELNMSRFSVYFRETVTTRCHLDVQADDVHAAIRLARIAFDDSRRAMLDVETEVLGAAIFAVDECADQNSAPALRSWELDGVSAQPNAPIAITD